MNGSGVICSGIGDVPNWSLSVISLFHLSLSLQISIKLLWMSFGSAREAYWWQDFWSWWADVCSVSDLVSAHSMYLAATYVYSTAWSMFINAPSHNDLIYALAPRVMMYLYRFSTGSASSWLTLLPVEEYQLRAWSSHSYICMHDNRIVS